jgi:hypothetical protein
VKWKRFYQENRVIILEEHNKHNNKNDVDSWNLLMPGGLLVVSYLLLYYLPQDTTLRFWMIFIVSVFMFCIGFFWFLAELPVPESKSGKGLLQGLLYAVAAGMFVFGLYRVYVDNGSYPSLAVCTLLLIEALVVITSGVSDKVGMNPVEIEKRNRYLWAIVAAMAVIGFWFFWKEISSDTTDNVGRIEVATMLWIAAAAIYGMFSVDTISFIKKKKGKKDR